MTPIQILLHGLIALVPLNDSTGAANHMWALLVDARNPPAQECLVAHQPLLTFDAKNKTQCKDGCQFNDEQMCQCTLDREEIALEIQPAIPEPVRQKLQKTPEHVLPFDSATADFSYVANLAQPKLGNQVLDPDLIARPLPAKTPQPLVARMEFPFTSLLVCSWGSRHEDGVDNVHSMSFRKLHEEEAGTNLNQAVAQSIQATLEIPAGSTVTLRLSKFDQLSSRTFDLASDPTGFHIELSNMRKGPDLRAGELCDDGVGRDFALFYNLVKNPPALWEDRVIPYVQYTRWKSALELKDSRCAGHKNPNSRPICPMASFNPETQP